MYRIMKLSGTMKDIRIILNLCSLIQSGLRLPENRIKLDASIHKTMPHHIQKISCLYFSFKTLNYLLLGVFCIDFHISVPFLRLACLDKFHKCFLIKSRFTIKFLRITFDISAMMNQIVFDVFFKSLFFYIKIRHKLHLLFACDNLVDEGFFVFLKFYNQSSFFINITINQVTFFIKIFCNFTLFILWRY
ncbi:unknown [Coprococcus eutactus CAG:665]|nr:unknown [Coprococcus eutactus CAG:665]